MQGYGAGGGGGGGLPEIHHFVVDGCEPSLFPVPAVGPPELHPASHKLIHHAPAQMQSAHFAGHFHPGVAITQQLFHPQFHLFHHPAAAQPPPPPPLQHLVLDHESGPENSSSPTPIIATATSSPGFLPAAVGFKLPIEEDGAGGGGDSEGLNHDAAARGGGGMLPWQRRDTSIKEPFWRPLDLEIDFLDRNHKHGEKDDPPATATPTPAVRERKQGGGNDGGCYKLFSELEAIYKPGGGSSSSHLVCDAHLESAAEQRSTDAGSTGEEEATPPAKKAKKDGRGKRSGRRQRSRRKRQRLAAISFFFERLVRKLMDHQEDLHRKFMESIQRCDEERAVREEAWRKQEAARARREDASRAHERALAASRESDIVSFLERVTGQSIPLPPSGEPETPGRWPKAEVEALIEVRSGLEARFLEPGTKGALWEEVSSAMAGLGYGRSAKRCKEKWENINKYFKKTKDSGRQRASTSKTCPYFHQLSHLYSQANPGSELLVVGEASGDVAAGKEEGDEVESHKDGCGGDAN